MLGNILPVFEKLGIKLEVRGDDIYVPAQERYEIQRFIDGSILTVAGVPGRCLRPIYYPLFW